jgi:hypothetical protein
MPDQPAPPGQSKPVTAPPAGSVSRDPTLKELLKKLAGRKVALSTRCGTFRQNVGVIKEVFDEFFLFLTIDERAMDQTPQRHWITTANIGVITEEPRLVTEELPITRYEL